MRLVSLLAVFAGLCVCSTVAYPNYYIIASRYFTPGAQYPVMVEFSDAVSGDVDVFAEISINNTWRSEVRQLASAGDTVSPGDKRTLTLNIPDEVEYNQFSLRVNLTGGIESVNVTHVSRTYQESDIAVIQLDKSVYKPGQTVNMRVIAVDPELKPYQGKVQVDIKDPKGNHLRRWSDLETDIGVVTLSMQLSDQPLLGSWRIEASFDNSTASASKTFSVDEYVLPKWSVDISLPSYLERSKKPTLQGSIEAQYTYGEGVKGSATITVRRPSYSYNRCSCENEDPDKYTLRRQTVTLSGQTTDFSVDFVLTDRYSYRVEVFVAVTEEVTGEVKNETGTVPIIDDPYRVSIAGSGQVKPGLPYNVEVKVNRYNDELLRPLDSKEVIIGYYMKVPEVTTTILPPVEPAADSLDVSNRHIILPPPPRSSEVEFVKKSYILPADGSVQLSLLPPDNTEQIQIEVYYAGQRRSTSYYSEYKSLNGVFVNVKQLSDSLNAGENGRFQVNSTKPISSFTHTVTADSDGLVQSDDVTAAEPTTVIAFDVPITSRMAPTAKLLVYYETDGELIADSITLNVDGAFQNQVSIEFNSTREEPGTGIQLSVQAAPDSFVGISAIDASVKLLGDSHDINRGQFVSEYGTGRYSSYDYNNHALDELRHAQIIMFTDAVVFDGRIIPVHDPCAPVQYAARGGGAGGFQAAQETVASDGVSSLAAAPPRSNARSGVSIGGAPAARVRKFFPETWLWINTTTDGDGVVNIDSTVPDTITSYVASAFSMSREFGIGISDQADLEVFRSFFITLQLPYSVTRGEDVEIRMSVFNYLDEDKQVAVTLERSEEFEAIFSEEEVISETLRKTVNVGKNDAESVSLMIRPAKVGMVKLRVLAQTNGAADSVVRELLVKPEGITVYQNEAIFVDVDSGDVLQQMFTPQFPDDAVEDSQRLEVSVSGDIMGPTIQSSGNLLRLPTGCGEQNMVKFAPNIYITNYLKTTSQLTVELAEKAERYMLAGYQRELTYQRQDGSFSAFGDNDDSGSVWLTAFVLKSFVEAKEHMYISQEVLDRASSWLLAKQREGKFTEVGRIISHNIQGGSGAGVALTAYSVIALKELEAVMGTDEPESELPVSIVGSSGPVELSVLPVESRVSPLFTQILENSVRFLEDGLDELSNGYDVAIVTYALHLSNSARAQDAYNKLQSLAVTDDNGLKYWRGEEDEFDDQPVVIYDSWLRTTKSTARIRPVDVEATSYALLTMALREEVEQGVPALRWLSKQRNSLGGFQSTQDTVVGLQALTEFAAMVYDPNTNLSLAVATDLSFTHTFTVDQKSSILLQSVVVPSPADVGELVFTADGEGTALLQVATSYNVINDTTASDVFNIEVDSRVGSGQKLKLGVCATYLLPGQSNMAVMEVNMPSGYTADMEEARTIADTDINVQRVEGEYGNTILYFYFNALVQNEPVCVSFQANKEFDVANRKPSAVSAYDYYDSMKKSTVYYTIGTSDGETSNNLVVNTDDGEVQGFFTG